MSNDAQSTPARIPCLDGIRALSIAMVLIAHLTHSPDVRISETARFYLDVGHLGVRVFFVISGFLITTLLLAEHDKYGSISLTRFYFRRTFRIFPAFYAFVLALLVAQAMGWIALRDGDVLHALTYTTNYHHDRAWELGHLWSLAVEEQFYLLWPAVFLLFGVRGALWVAVAYLFVAPAVRVVTWQYFPDHRAGIGETFQTVADAIATGCVLAFVRLRWARFARLRELARHPVLACAYQSPLTPAVLAVATVALHYQWGAISFSYPVGETLTNLCIALFIDWCVRHPDSRLGTFLDWRPLAYVGLLSYSLYLWQQPFMSAQHPDAIVTRFPFNLVLAFTAAMASYYLVEQPFLRWRSRLGKKWLPRRTPVSRSAPAER